MIRTILAICLGAALLALPPRERPLLVSAAISLTDALQAVAAQYQHEGGEAVQFNFAGSNVLARQILNGAPADVFISADALQMEFTVQRGAVESSRPLLANRLAIVTPPGRSGTIRDVAALAGARRIAIGDPAAVPAGVYAKRYLEAAGQWQAVEPRLLPLANVRAALAAAESGGADAAIVYETDAAVSKKVEVGYVVTGPHAPRIIYPAAVVTRSRSKAAARRFLEFLHGHTAGEIFRRHRFLHGAELGRDTPAGR